MGRSQSRVLGYTVPVLSEDGSIPARTFPAGTSEDDIPEEYLERITNPKAWDPSPASVDVSGDQVGPQYVENDTAPNTLDECNADELRVIARRYEIGLGNLKDPEKIRQVLRDSGIGDDGTDGS